MNKIVIIGVGQLGSHLLLAGRNWEGSIKVVDFDKVEMKNTQSQFHSKLGLRRNKTISIQQAMQGMFGIRIETVPHRLTTDNADQILGDATLVIDCTDNFNAREVIQNFVRAKGIACVHGALDANGTFGRVVWDEHFKADAEGVEGEATCEDGETLPFGMLTASMLAVATQNFLRTGKKHSFQISHGGVQRIA
jgi:molybdopterin/thiamine biosynthesis adenylyltransferase